ncbi:MAG TPA: EF-P lysine aminoacylase EpmA [bacterium]|nr:EF-P lysine aminoacylase EpmA [bacterium]
MARPVPGQVHHARIADLHPPERPTRIALYLGETLLLYDASPERLAGLHPHALVTFTVDARGALMNIAPEPDHVPPRVRPDGDALRWRQAPGGVPRMRLLALRHRILQAVRAWFDAQGFLEVETPALVLAPSPEPVFEPLAAGPEWLITSPEFQLKRMLVGGFERIYRLGPVFRGAEVGAHHNPEFTLLEWYRAHADTDALAADLEGLIGALAPLAAEAAALWPDATRTAHLRERAAALARRPYRRATVRALFAEHLGADLRGVTTAEALHGAARAAGVPGAEALPGDFTGAFSALWLRIEAALGPEPLLVTEWPAPAASLARLKPDDPSVAERMELYAGGLELANGFAELTDPAEQRRRFEADLAARRAQGLPPVPLDEAFLTALEEGMPPSAGMALGVDRLVLLLTGAETLREVLPFAWDER